MIAVAIVHRTNKIFTLNLRYYSHIKLIKKMNCNMDAAYFRHKNGQENYELTFLLNNASLGVNRQFNFTRKSTESIGNLIDRISINVEKSAQKKNKKNKKTGGAADVGELVDVKFVQNGEEVSKDKPCLEVLKTVLATQLLIKENVFNIIVNAPCIVSFHLPVSMLAGFPIYPSKFEGHFLSKRHCQFVWYSGFVKEKQNINMVSWEKVGEGFTYFTSIADIGKNLKVVCTPGNENLNGPEAEVVSENKVEAGPGLCPFDNRHLFTKEETSGKVFRVVTYNILADLYCDSDFSRTVLYPYCPPYALHMDYRKQLIVKEILGYNCDIICLQEVDSKIFDLDLEPLLNEHGFEGVFSKKGGQVAEGLACFFKTRRFRLVKNYSTLLADEIQTSPIFEDLRTKISNNNAFKLRITERTTIAQATVLQSTHSDKEIVVVGNTHLYFHPDADHVRLMQGGIVIRWLNTIINQLQNEMPDKRVSLVLCGDFNSVPSCGIYKLYTTGVAPSDMEDWKSNEEEALTDISLVQPRILSSACGTPNFTNYTAGFADCLDYIFHDTNLKSVQVIPFPTLEELQQNTALPSIVFPSDHVALVSDLEFY